MREIAFTFVLTLFSPLVAAQLSAPPLDGIRVVISAGHGYYYNFSLGFWTTQRSSYWGLTEDFITVETVMDHVVPQLENAGARVFTVRPRTRQTSRDVRDNDLDAGGRYSETGSWTTTATVAQGYAGTDYRFTLTAAVESATATWTPDLPLDGVYPVYVWFVASGNRSSTSLWRIQHSGGTSQVLVDQQVDDSRWVHLGNWHFAAGSGSITLSNEGSEVGSVVIADAVRFGDGMGDIDRGGGVSGQPKWRESARYWLEDLGAPSFVYDAYPGLEDRSDDVICRPFYADWQGADCYVSLHSNGAGGTGTSSFIYNGGAYPGSDALQNSIHTQIVGDIRANWDAGWTDRGMMSANFGELRECVTMPSVLIELAFHDRQTPDNDYLHEDDFRDLSARAIAKGIVRYFSPGAPIAPLPPRELLVRGTSPSTLTVSWSPTVDPIEGALAQPVQYRVETSPNGLGFDDGTTTASTFLDLTGLAPNTLLYVRVRAENAGGLSLPTEVLAARTGSGSASVLLVNGFDRMDRSVTRRDNENTRDYVRQHGAAIDSSLAAGRGFDGASNEAVSVGSVSLTGHEAVVWILGEESTADETFSDTEQGLVTAYLSGGGGLFVTGAEIAWDLDLLGSGTDRAFLASLGATYTADDAGVYSVSPEPGGIYDGIGSFAFDDGTGGTYDVDFPDVYGTTGGSIVQLRYGGATTGAVSRDTGVFRTVVWGFPFETVLDPGVRAEAMQRTLTFLGVSTGTCGDCDANGLVDVLDALRASQAAVGIVTLTDPDYGLCNVTGVPGGTGVPGAVVDILDALDIARFSLALLPALFCAP